MMPKGTRWLKHLFTEKPSEENVHTAIDYLAPRDLCGLIVNPNKDLMEQTVFYGEHYYRLCYESCVWTLIADIAKDRGEKFMYLCALMSYMTVLEDEYQFCKYQDDMANHCAINIWRKKHKDMEEKIEEAIKLWKEDKNGCNLERD